MAGPRLAPMLLKVLKGRLPATLYVMVSGDQTWTRQSPSGAEWLVAFTTAEQAMASRQIAGSPYTHLQPAPFKCDVALGMAVDMGLDGVVLLDGAMNKVWSQWVR